MICEVEKVIIQTCKVSKQSVENAALLITSTVCMNSAIWMTWCLQVVFKWFLRHHFVIVPPFLFPGHKVWLSESCLTSHHHCCPGSSHTGCAGKNIQTNKQLYVVIVIIFSFYFFFFHWNFSPIVEYNM